MKQLRLFTSVPMALAMTLAFSETNLAEVPRLQVNSNLPLDPLVLNGTSGGKVSSNCGNIANSPNQIIQLSKPLPYLRLTVDSPGQPTLLIDGPGGRFCVLADNYSGSKPELSGYWAAGEYSLYVGELSPVQHNYTLSISRQKKPTR
jgi:hypothetical protein